MTSSQLCFSGIALSPLLGSILAFFPGKHCGRTFAHTVTILGVFVSLVFAVLISPQVLSGNTFHGIVYTWFFNGINHFYVSFFVDQLALVMIFVVTVVSLMVHVYSVGYMKDDPGYQRFFSYISLFTFFMLVLVVSDNLLQLFFGWEGVGLVSYLLIGFWYGKRSSVRASLKAFIVNRVGDVGFVFGMVILFYLSKTMDIFTIVKVIPASLQLFPSYLPMVTLACFSLFVGAMSKSAQFPLHIWLPDSMEGPTPISALIHAATMVTAGVFMVVRLMPLFKLSASVLSFILVISGITSFFLGLVAVVQNDIKRIIAYSTISQLGYMCVAIGLNAPSFAIFHLVTHAFFKALLFLSAGSVIVSMHHEQDIRKMGGLFRHMPITWITSFIGSMALVGFPFTSGFYSKHMIIDAAHISSGNAAIFAYYATMGGVFVTACYTFRLFFTVFHGKERFHDLGHCSSVAKNSRCRFPLESPVSILVPLVVLAAFSLFSGYHFIYSMASGGSMSHIAGKISPISQIIFNEIKDQGGIFAFTIHSFTTSSFLLLILGGVVGWQASFDSPIMKIVRNLNYLSPVYNILDRKYYLDELADGVSALSLRKYRFASWIDKNIIDRLVNSVSSGIKDLSESWRIMQTGMLDNYAMFMFFGVVALLFFPMASSFYS
ncbi:NADH-quinone oxidoreductase subunit L [Candidatus Ichthyocystis sparus]|uniref:NADH-quinone oxidoreductase subunit L n=1 Tax=Candidatus Ichthyocystis sparus TaxID=1561004 RepID=UPI000AE7A6AD|nr:NADH-quinone oxidoreductase subunit L [Candidatus Ichthyocystis sparus]